MCRLKVDTFIIFFIKWQNFSGHSCQIFYRKFFSNAKRLNIVDIFQDSNIISENVNLSNRVPKV